MNKIVLFCLMLGFSIPVFSQGTTWIKKSDSKFFYTLSFPSNWKYRLQEESTRFFITSPAEGDEDRFMQNVNLQAGKVTPGAKFKDYVNQNLLAIMTAVKEFDEISSRYFKWNGREAFEIEYTGKIEQVPYRLHWKQRYIFHRGAALVFTYTADGENDDQLRPVADKVFNLVKFN